MIIIETNLFKRMKRFEDDVLLVNFVSKNEQLMLIGKLYDFFHVFSGEDLE